MPRGYKIRPSSRQQQSQSSGVSAPISVPVVGAPDGALKTQTGYFTPRQIEEIQRNPQNRVYGYEYDQVDRVLEPDEVSAMMTDANRMYSEIRTERPNADDKDIREYLIETHPEWKTPATHTYKRMFEYATSVKCNMGHLQFMISLKKEEQQTKMKDEDRMKKFNEYFYEKLDTGMTVEEYEAKMKEEDEREGKQTQFGISNAPSE